MLKRYFTPIVLASLVLAGCQSPPEGKFTPEQIAAMKSYGFNQLNGDWSWDCRTKFCLIKTTPDCVRRVNHKSRLWHHAWPQQA